MLHLSHLTVDVDVLLVLLQLLLLHVRRPVIVLGVVAGFGKLMRQLIARRLKFCDVVFELSDSSDLLRDDGRR